MLTQSEIQDGEIVRIVFSENSAFEPVIANLILTFHEPVNILKANTKNVGGVAKGEMILQFMSDSTNVPEMKKFLTERGLEIGEWRTDYVDETSNRYDNRRCRGNIIYDPVFHLLRICIWNAPWNPAESIRQRGSAAKRSTI